MVASELSQSKSEPARVIELELPHRYDLKVLRGLRFARTTRDLVRSRSSFEATA